MDYRRQQNELEREQLAARREAFCRLPDGAVVLVGWRGERWAAHLGAGGESRINQCCHCRAAERSKKYLVLSGG